MFLHSAPRAVLTSCPHLCEDTPRPVLPQPEQEALLHSYFTRTAALGPCWGVSFFPVYSVMEDAAPLLQEWNVGPGNKKAFLFLCDGSDMRAAQWCWEGKGHKRLLSALQI